MFSSSVSIRLARLSAALVNATSALGMNQWRAAIDPRFPNRVGRSAVPLLTHLSIIALSFGPYDIMRSVLADRGRRLPPR